MSENRTRTLITVKLDGLAEAAHSVPGIEVDVAYERAAMLERIGDAEVICVDRFDAELLAAATNVRWIHAMMGGVERILFPELINSPVAVTCSKQCFGMPGAQHAMASMLVISSRLNDYWWMRSRRELKWRLPRELQGKTLGIVGFGNIGQTLATLAKPFGMRVLAIARQPRRVSSPADKILPPEHLLHLLAESDFVVIAVPLTTATRGLIGERELKAFMPTAWLIDISGRPAIVDPEAVIRSLDLGLLAGADLQFSTAPASSSPLWQMENLIMSQYSANSEEEVQRCNDLFAENLRRFRENQPLQGLVNKLAGY